MQSCVGFENAGFKYGLYIQSAPAYVQVVPSNIRKEMEGVRPTELARVGKPYVAHLHDAMESHTVHTALTLTPWSSKL